MSFNAYAPTGDSWPGSLGAAAYHGVVGEFVQLLLPHTEADPVAVHTQLLTGFGNLIGRGVHFRAEADQHHANLFVVLVGVSSKGRKGTAWGQASLPLRELDEEWAKNRQQAGLSSGEGLIWAVRDPIWTRPQARKAGRVVDYEEVESDPGVEDKRLLVVESEMVSVLRVIQRDGNTLSPLVRRAWDSGDLQTLTKNAPAKATGAHISIIGHINRDELRRYLDRTEVGNGFANRFLWVCVRRSKYLPDGGNIARLDFAPVVQELRASAEFARGLGSREIVRDDAARDLWHSVYQRLSDGHPGLFGAVTSRAEAQVMRIALIYAVLDRSEVIRLEHLQASLAVWSYAEDSARYIFGDALGDPFADELLRVLRGRPEGMTRTEIRDHFGRNKPAAQVDRALAFLLEHGLVRMEKEETGGRPAERWLVVEGYAVNDQNAVSQDRVVCRVDPDAPQGPSKHPTPDASQDDHQGEVFEV